MILPQDECHERRDLVRVRDARVHAGGVPHLLQHGERLRMVLRRRDLALSDVLEAKGEELDGGFALFDVCLLLARLPVLPGPEKSEIEEPAADEVLQAVLGFPNGMFTGLGAGSVEVEAAAMAPQFGPILISIGT